MAEVNRAYVEALLVGVPLPAKKGELLAYAEEQGAREDAIAALRELPDGHYRSLNEVGEAIQPVDPPRKEPERKVPRAESGEPPGGRQYTSTEPRPR